MARTAPAGGGYHGRGSARRHGRAAGPTHRGRRARAGRGAAAGAGRWRRSTTSLGRWCAKRCACWPPRASWMPARCVALGCVRGPSGGCWIRTCCAGPSTPRAAMRCSVICSRSGSSSSPRAARLAAERDMSPQRPSPARSALEAWSTRARTSRASSRLTSVLHGIIVAHDRQPLARGAHHAHRGSTAPGPPGAGEGADRGSSPSRRSIEAHRRVVEAIVAAGRASGRGSHARRGRGGSRRCGTCGRPTVLRQCLR